MDQHHSPALDRLIRRQRVSGEPGTVPDAAAAAAESSAPASSSSPAAAATTTTTTQAQTTTTQAPVVSTTTTTSAQPESSSSSLVPSSSTTTTTTTTTPVQSSSSAAPSSSSTTTTTTTTPATSSTTSTTTSSTTARDTTSQQEQADTAFSTSARTTVVIVSGSASSGTSSGSASLASSTAGSSSSSSIGTGGVIGIVAGAVVGVVFVAALVAFLFKKYSRKDDDDQISPFDKDEFRRASVMLDDDDAYPESYHGGGGAGMGHSPQMSEYSMSNVGVGAVLPGLARGGTLNNPRPPTAIMNHYNHQQMMPSFQPGQVIPTSPSPPIGAGAYGQQQHFANHSPPLGGNYAPMDPYAYPQPPHPAQFADQTGGLSTAAAGHWNGVAPPMQGTADLSRNNSQLSSYSQFSDGAAPRQLVRPGGGGSSSHGHPDERPLSLVQEDDEPYSPSHGSFSRQQRGQSIEYVPERSGTPTNSNVQQTFFGAQGVTTAETGNDWEKEERDREYARRLSIRNGGLDQFDERDDPYDGMH